MVSFQVLLWILVYLRLGIPTQSFLHVYHKKKKFESSECSVSSECSESSNIKISAVTSLKGPAITGHLIFTLVQNLGWKLHRGSPISERLCIGQIISC